MYNTHVSWVIGWFKSIGFLDVNIVDANLCSRLSSISGIIVGLRRKYVYMYIDGVHIYKFSGFCLYSDRTYTRSHFRRLSINIRTLLYRWRVIRNVTYLLLRDRRAIRTAQLKPAHGQRSRGNAKSVRYANTLLNRFCTAYEGGVLSITGQRQLRYSKAAEQRLQVKRKKSKIKKSLKKVKKASEYRRRRSAIKDAWA